MKEDTQKFPEVYEEARRYFETKGFKNLDLKKGPQTGWRCRAKLVVRGTAQHPLVGLYQEGTHEVIDLPNCPAHHPNINEAIERVRAFIKLKKIEPYNEVTHRGILRYVQFVVERSTGKVQLTWVINTEDAKSTDWELTPEEMWHSIWLNFNTTKTNTILGSKWRLVKGAPLLWENVGEVMCCFHPASFAQANLDLFEKMLLEMKDHIPKGAHVAEFYAGVGVIGFVIAEQCAWIRCCEITPQAEACFLEAQKKLAPELAKRVTFYQGLAVKHLALIEEADTVIVDPPRKGLDRQLLNALKQAYHLKALIYVSCGWKSFQRDCDELLQSGWKLHHVSLYLFFPESNHLETLAIFVH